MMMLTTTTATATMMMMVMVESETLLISIVMYLPSLNYVIYIEFEKLKVGYD